MRQLDGIVDSMDMSLNTLWEMTQHTGRWDPVCCGPLGSEKLDTTERLNNNKMIYPTKG